VANNLLVSTRAVPRGRSTARAAAPAQAGRRWQSSRARRVNGEYIAKARTLDHEHSRQADGTRYPGVREQVQGHRRRPGAGSAAGLGPGARPGGGLVRTRAAARRCTTSRGRRRRRRRRRSGGRWGSGGAPAARPRATHPACPYSVLFVYCETHIVVFLFFISLEPCV